MATPRNKYTGRAEIKRKKTKEKLLLSQCLIMPVSLINIIEAAKAAINKHFN